MTASEAARRHGVSVPAVLSWRNKFLDAGRQSLVDGVPGGPSKTAGSAVERRLRLENGQLKLALAEATVQLRIWQKGAEYVEAVPSKTSRPYRAAAGLPVSRFARLAGIPRRSYCRRLARLRHGDPVKGPWPAPVVDSVEAWPAWGHRKIAALMRADGHVVSTSTVERALRRRGLLLPVGYRADRKSWAVIRRRVFRDPPTQRNRVWQTDFSEFETSRGGIWRICAVIDYATKYCLAVTITPTARGQDALACLDAAVQHAERILRLEDLRADRGEVDLVDETTGEVLRTVPAPIAVVSDNGPCFRGAVFAEAFTGDDPLLRHVRTRVKSPQTNGVIERFFGTPKYEHLFRGPIDDAGALAVEVGRFRQIYSTIRPHPT